jgi:predicted nucleic-acid-binding Zn-ribbon protein
VSKQVIDGENEPMKTGICPKCGSDEVYVRRKSQGAYYSNAIPLGGSWSFRYFSPDTYICANCGYIERYVSEEDRDKVARKWERADGRPKRKRKDSEW